MINVAFALVLAAAASTAPSKLSPSDAVGSDPRAPMTALDDPRQIPDITLPRAPAAVSNAGPIVKPTPKPQLLRKDAPITFGAIVFTQFEGTQQLEIRLDGGRVGQLRGRADDPVRVATLRPGIHSLELRDSTGHAVWSGEVMVIADDTVSIEVGRSISSPSHPDALKARGGAQNWF